MTASYLTAALYKFVDLPDHADWREPLMALCREHRVKGTLLLAPEGINGTIAGPEAGVQAVLAWLRRDARLADLQHKASWSDHPPFHRLKVRLKREIMTLRVPGLRPQENAGRYVKPEDWNALIAQPDVLLIDTRNDYEVKIGSFDGAINPGIRAFTDLPGWLASQPALQGAAKPRVAMFCTGGIRCEKSTALLRMQGFDEVYHLEGGILKYLEQVPESESRWRGDCFVFDERVSVGHGLRPGAHALCRSCRWPLSEADRASPLFEEGVSCPHCHGRRDDGERERLAERQRQVALARERGLAHIGADAMPPAGSATGGQAGQGAPDRMGAQGAQSQPRSASGSATR
ncbi:MAG: rhodanese-related sulfurtransferase [Hydrogenophaga sp.]|uniref:oxygen-dependent tRNA uridine(34) hydroxylase TrhO n=1 Tax=Hydrogenophaga sp. TaxID=1904254 RepID=UPI0016AF9399|nr:rhodanese-related sulfurtransferase [Hydrogenophaga sp.]NIM42874.1 rhodanese-related sulfurtransferase [Hydrogenophaga sp.]NIN27807.1 rhodanese-related sulfurtransferase [Hydrogenophaga sp.]NIN32626.1 rhodanese-related sulfurtransferase [Hydrogenophaga sp.]NIN57080.1 rhodanese-related sulfurtransferase [Hydrogenophaga sp.]NIO53491.1 rhodanese-related sulfurtransferase [Hydrogenophaga sp.]